MAFIISTVAYGAPYQKPRKTETPVINVLLPWVYLKYHHRSPGGIWLAQHLSIRRSCANDIALRKTACNITTIGRATLDRSIICLRVVYMRTELWHENHFVKRVRKNKETVKHQSPTVSWQIETMHEKNIFLRLHRQPRWHTEWHGHYNTLRMRHISEEYKVLNVSLTQSDPFFLLW